MTDSAIRVTLVLVPDLTYERISDAMVDAGWKVVDQSASPLLPGEPEHAAFEPSERKTHGRVQYTFNPVCRLRVLEADDSPLPLPDLPVADPVMIAIWLQSDDDRTVLRGILAARNLNEAGLLDRVERHFAHPRASIAEAARSAVTAMRRTIDSRSEAETLIRTADARAESLGAVRRLEQQLEPLLTALGQNPSNTAPTFRPRVEDYARAFLPAVAGKAREAFEAVWAGGARVEKVPADWVVECHIAPAGMLTSENEMSRAFPGGYRAIAHLLDPHRVWVSWRYLRPGATAGQSYDGLVWLDDHWAWFPKPYRVLRHLVEEP